MGFSDWLARKGNIGGTARAVANAWKNIKNDSPEMKPREIAEAYCAFRYGITNEPHLAKKAIHKLPAVINPLILSWTILIVENDDELSTVLINEKKWKQIMREEIEKCGIDPE